MSQSKRSRKNSRKHNKKTRGGCGCASRKNGGTASQTPTPTNSHHGGSGAAEYAQEVYGSPQHAVSQQDNTIAMNRVSGGAGAAEYAQEVYGSPQHAVSAQDNTIAMNHVRGGSMSPANVSASDSGLSDQASNILSAASAHGATDMMNIQSGGTETPTPSHHPSLSELAYQDLQQRINTNNTDTPGTFVNPYTDTSSIHGGNLDIVVPAVMLMTNEAYKRGFGKKSIGKLTKTLKNVTTRVGSRFSRRTRKHSRKHARKHARK